MAKPRIGRLKVFQARLGFYDSVVAAPSQAAALRAWGVHQNLFAGGQAAITADEQARAAALEHPETPLLRAVGSDAPFTLKPSSLPKAPDEPKPRARPKAKAVPPPPSPPPDRSAVDAAEARLGEVDARWESEDKALSREQEDLDVRRAAARNAHLEVRRKAENVLGAARDAYRKAGGAD